MILRSSYLLLSLSAATCLFSSPTATAAGAGSGSTLTRTHHSLHSPLRISDGNRNRKSGDDKRRVRYIRPSSGRKLNQKLHDRNSKSLRADMDKNRPESSSISSSSSSGTIPDLGRIRTPSLFGSRAHNSFSRYLQGGEPIDRTIGWLQMGSDVDADAYYDRAGDAVAMNYDATRMAYGAYNFAGGRGNVKVFDWIPDSGATAITVTDTGTGTRAGTWIQVGQTITGLSGDDHGKSVSLNKEGDILAIGAPNHSNYLGTTRVYAYNSELDRWEAVGTDLDGIARGDKQGVSTSLNGDGTILAVGADEGDNTEGYARVYIFDGGNWNQVGQTIFGGTNYATGSTVKLNEDGTKLLVASEFRPLDNGQRLGGAVDVYAYDAASLTWIQLGESFRGLTYYELFGSSADMNAAGDRIVIGASNFDHGTVGENSGLVQVFRFLESEDTWVQVGNDIVGLDVRDKFGVSVGIDDEGNRIIAGSAKADLPPNLRDIGETRVFHYDPSIDDWVQVGKTIVGEGRGDESGRAVGISGNGISIIVGAPLNGYYAGHVRMYEATPGLIQPTAPPTGSPTKAPTFNPTKEPSPSPSVIPTGKPSLLPTTAPSETLTESPSQVPTSMPSSIPSAKPSSSPTAKPSSSPTKSPTKAPTKAPTDSPTKEPTDSPTKAPTKLPTKAPTKSPTKAPTKSPTKAPTKSPTKATTESPTKAPTDSPTKAPTDSPTTAPTDPSAASDSGRVTVTLVLATVTTLAFLLVG